MHVTIAFEVADSGEQTPLIADLLAALAARETPTQEKAADWKAAAPAVTEKKPVNVTEIKPKPAAKKAPAPKPEPVEEEDSGVPMALEEDEPESAEEPAEETEEEEYTLDHAIARATELVHQKKQPEIRKVLRSLGHNRVTELKPSEVKEFLKALA